MRLMGIPQREHEQPQAVTSFSAASSVAIGTHTAYTVADLCFVASINLSFGLQVPLWGSKVSQQSGNPCVAITV